MESGKMRINRYVALCGSLSRRDADKAIDEGRVRVNGAPALKGMLISATDMVELDGIRICPPDKKSYYLYYKPRGIVCTARDAHAALTVTDEIKRLSLPQSLTYAGRLDKESEGLLILTDDGEFIEKMMRAGTGHEKEYLVSLDLPVTDEFLRKMSSGLYLEDMGRRTNPCKVEKTGPREFRIILTQGMNRQIRRMCASLGYSVTKLLRTRIENWELGDLEPGEARKIEIR